jgi:hypothetical protein
MEQHALKYVNNCLNTNIYSYLETSGGRSYNLYKDVFLSNTSVNWASVAAQDGHFPALVSNMPCSIRHWTLKWVNSWIQSLRQGVSHISRIFKLETNPMGLYQPLDGDTNLKYKQLCFLSPNKKNSKRKALAFN